MNKYIPIIIESSSNKLSEKSFYDRYIMRYKSLYRHNRLIFFTYKFNRWIYGILLRKKKFNKILKLKNLYLYLYSTLTKTRKMS